MLVALLRLLLFQVFTGHSNLLPTTDAGAGITMVCWDFRVPKLPVVDRVLLKTFRHVFEAGTVTAVSLINAFSFGITFASLLAAAGSGYDLLSTQGRLLLCPDQRHHDDEYGGEDSVKYLNLNMRIKIMIMKERTTIGVQTTIVVTMMMMEMVMMVRWRCWRR